MHGFVKIMLHSSHAVTALLIAVALGGDADVGAGVDFAGCCG
jgi:hypothetical protein